MLVFSNVPRTADTCLHLWHSLSSENGVNSTLLTCEESSLEGQEEKLLPRDSQIKWGKLGQGQENKLRKLTVSDKPSLAQRNIKERREEAHLDLHYYVTIKFTIKVMPGLHGIGLLVWSIL